MAQSHLGQLMAKQRLKDLHHKLSGLISSYLVLIKEGEQAAVEEAREKAKSEFHKIGPDMETIAKQIKGSAIDLTDSFLKAVEGILLSGKTEVDPAKVAAFHQANEAFAKEFA